MGFPNAALENIIKTGDTVEDLRARRLREETLWRPSFFYSPKEGPGVL